MKRFKLLYGSVLIYFQLLYFLRTTTSNKRPATEADEEKSRHVGLFFVGGGWCWDDTLINTVVQKSIHQSIKASKYHSPPFKFLFQPLLRLLF